MKPYNKCICFVHVPKTGGTSINPKLRKYFKTNSPDIEYIHHDHNTRRKNYIYFRQRQQLLQNSYSFAFVRNPWSRLVSSYYYLKAQYESGNLVAPDDRADYIKYLKRYKSFEDMVRNWDPSLNEQIHLKPQYEWVCDENNNILPTQVKKYEYLQNHFDEICKDMSIPTFSLPNNNANKKYVKHYRECYNDETQRIVSKIYGKDIELFKYTF